MDIEFNKNEDVNKQSVYELRTKLKKIYQGGGEKSAAKQKEKGKLLARERIAYLIDENSQFLEVGAFAADGMYAEQGGCPSAGVVCGIGYVSGRQCMIVANDATVKAGA
ncbi:MAG TPA: carboxyl transferase domain-containing protein, partial [Pedobacter sp.]